MRSGNLDRYVEIQRKTLTTDDYGATIESWSTYTKLWARRKSLNMSERIQAQQVDSSLTGSYETWYRSDIDEEDRLIDGSTTLEITGVNEIGRKLGVELIVRTI